MENPPKVAEKLKENPGVVLLSFSSPRCCDQWQIFKAKFCSVMEFPPAWNVVEVDQFALAQPRAAGLLGMGLLVQARPNGRMLDHYRVTLGREQDYGHRCQALRPGGGATHQGVAYQDADMAALCIDVCRNMTSTTWMDLFSLVAAQECQVLTMDGENERAVAPEEFQAIMAEAGAAAALRFAVVIGGDQRMALALQGLPASADLLLGKPAFRG
jgi:hypothetical protein